MLAKILFGFPRSFLSGLYAVLISVVTFFLYQYISVVMLSCLLLIANGFIVKSLVYNRLGIIPCARYLFIIAPGILQFFFWHMSGSLVSVAILGNDYLKDDVINFVAVISTVGAASANFGFLLYPVIWKPVFKLPERPGVINKIFFILFFGFAIMYARSIGGSILEAGYSNEAGEGSGAKIGTLNVFFFYFFGLFFYYKYWKRAYTKIELFFYLSLTFITVMYLATRGVRQDSIGFFLAIYTIVICKKRVQAGKPLYWFIVFIFFISWIGAIFSGMIREEVSGANLLSIIQNPLLAFTIILPTGYVVFNMNTASMTIGTLNIIPYKVIDSGFLYGKSFVDWIPRTLPDMIYPDRPLGPEFEMHYNGEWFGWGGIHEIAEVYWNFGFFGIIIIPFIFSYLIKSLGTSFLRSESFLTPIPIVWLIMMPRWIWYQTFALYKSTLTMCLLALFLLVIFTISFGKKNPAVKL